MPDLTLKSDPIASQSFRHRILVVEDQWLVAMHAQILLESLKCEVIGPAGSVKEGLYLVEQSDLTGAILDIELGLYNSFRIAEILTERHIPFVFVSGYNATAVDDQFRGVPHFDKPYTIEMVRKILRIIRTARASTTLPGQ